MNYVVAVRALCEFTARQGDLDLRFTPSPSAQEGVAGHGWVTARRDADYQTEIALDGEHGPLRVRGRADGYDPRLHRLEEIKTYRGDLDRVPHNHRSLHWAQAKVYGHLLCRKSGFQEITLALVYFDIVSQKETVLVQHCGAAELQAFFSDQCERFLVWAEQELAHRAERDAALTALTFPHGVFRAGQRDLAKTIYRAARDGHCVMAQAPTGIGKTMGTIFPLLKAGPESLDKVFFLCAKTAGRKLALDAIDRLRQENPALPLRTLELVAREQACEHRDKACHGGSCPLAQGFHDRLPQARAAALRRRALDRGAVRQVALAHDVCPYFLAQELARWSDIVVGDYNYYFDYNALLYGLTLANQWRVGVLVDEAHNMLERARNMYTAELRLADLARVRRAAPPALRKPLDAVHRKWREILKDQDGDYAVHACPPAKLLALLQQAAAAMADHFAETPGHADESLQRFYFDALRFGRTAEHFGEHSLFDISTSAPLPGAKVRESVLCIRNVVPAPFLAPRFRATRTTVLFSATLNPARFYLDTLGVPDTCQWLDVRPPFKPGQLAIHVVGNVSTRYRDRGVSVLPIVDLMAKAFSTKPGNYLCFASSFEYSGQLSRLMRQRHPGVPLWEQAPGMDEPQRDAFLARFTPSSQGIGFAVLGGAFGEGIDLPGARLIGAFIVTLGLPRMNAVNEQMMLRMQARFGNGYDYTYLYPGLQKVVQAAGRVIRSEQDEGSVYLIDDRFRHLHIQKLLPSWWNLLPLIA